MTSHGGHPSSGAGEFFPFAPDDNINLINESAKLIGAFFVPLRSASPCFAELRRDFTVVEIAEFIGDNSAK